MPKLPDDLKAAIVRMPVKEKDKLLLRLVAKDQALINRLTYELLEGGDDPTERREELRRAMGASLATSGEGYYTPGYLLLDLRHWNGRISEHVKTTKDKFGDVELRLWMLNEAMRLYRPMLDKFPGHRSDTLAPYLVQRTVYILKNVEKLHEDYFLELREPLNRWLSSLYGFKPSAQLAREEEVPRKWLE